MSVQHTHQKAPEPAARHPEQQDASADDREQFNSQSSLQQLMAAPPAMPDVNRQLTPRLARTLQRTAGNQYTNQYLQRMRQTASQPPQSGGFIDSFLDPTPEPTSQVQRACGCQGACQCGADHDSEEPEAVVQRQIFEDEEYLIGAEGFDFEGGEIETEGFDYGEVIEPDADALPLFDMTPPQMDQPPRLDAPASSAETGTIQRMPDTWDAAALDFDQPAHMAALPDLDAANLNIDLNPMLGGLDVSVETMTQSALSDATDGSMDITPGPVNTIQRISFGSLDPRKAAKKIKKKMKKRRKQAMKGARRAYKKAKKKQNKLRGKLNRARNMASSRANTLIGKADTFTKPLRDISEEAVTKAAGQGSELLSIGGDITEKITGMTPAIEKLMNPIEKTANPQASKEAETDMQQNQTAMFNQKISGVLDEIPKPKCMEEGLALHEASDENMGEDKQSGWKCDMKSILALMADVLGDAALASLQRAEAALQNVGDFASRIPNIGKYVSGMAAGLRAMAQTVQRVFNAIKHCIMKYVMMLVEPILKALKAVVKTITGIVKKIKKFVQEQITKVTKWISKQLRILRKAIGYLARKLIGGMKKLARKAGKLLGRLLRGLAGAIKRLLPKWVRRAAKAVKKAINKMRRAIQRGINRLKQMYKQFINFFKRLRKRMLDTLMRAIALAYQAAKLLVTNQIEAIKKLVSAVKSMIPGPILKLINKAKDLAGKLIAKAQEALPFVRDQLSGAECAVVNEIGTPCLEQYLPLGDDDTRNSIQATISGKSGKFDKQSSLTLTRESKKKYSVNVVGELSVPMMPGGGETSAPAASNGGSKGKKKSSRQQVLINIMQRHASENMPDIPSPSLPGLPDLSSGGPEMNKEVETEATGYCDVVYEFEVNDSNCDVFNMFKLIAAFGAKNILAMVKGPLFDIIGEGATIGYFWDYVKTVKVGVRGQAKGSATGHIMQILGADVGDFDTSLGVGAGAGLEIEKDDKGNIDASMVLDFNMESSGTLNKYLPGNLSQFDTVSVILRLILGLLENDLVEPRAIDTILIGQVSSDNFDPARLPDSFPRKQIADKLKKIKKGGGSGTVEVEMKVTSEDIGILLNAIDDYLTQDLDDVSYEGFMKMLEETFDSLPKTTSLSVKMTEISDFDPVAEFTDGLINTQEGLNLFDPNNNPLDAGVDLNRVTEYTLYEGEFES